MKFEYNINPLSTKIILDDTEKEIFKLKIKIKEMENNIFEAHFYLKETQYRDETQALSALDPDYYFPKNDDELSKLDKRVQELFDYGIEELKSIHIGDCSAHPASCYKCFAEGILGIDTTQGISKHGGLWLFNYFTKKENIEKTAEEVISDLSCIINDTNKYI